MDKLKHIRQEYNKFALSEADLTKDPLDLFERWMDIALDSEEVEPTAMQFATVDGYGQPSLRVLLLKGFDESGFSFYTNYASKKGEDMTQNPKVAMTIFWKTLHKQIRVEGQVEKMPRETSVAYFQSRPRESQIGAWASSQSAVLSGPEELSASFEKIEAQFAGQESIPCPEDWGGYFLKPNVIEFWQGRPSRLHDRFKYERIGNDWTVNRLWP